MEQLSQKHCAPNPPGTLPLTPDQALAMKASLHGSWDLTLDSTCLERVFRFKNFKNAMAFAVRVGDIAEAENHHPDLHVSWGRLRVDITSHDVHGLSENDFILAARIDALAAE